MNLLKIDALINRFQWKEEFCTYMPRVPLHHVHVLTNSKDYMDVTTQVLITSYDLMVSQSTDLLKKQFGVVIMVMSHFFLVLFLNTGALKNFCGDVLNLIRTVCTFAPYENVSLHYLDSHNVLLETLFWKAVG